MSFHKTVKKRIGFLAIILFSLAFLLITSGSFALPNKIDALSIKITSSKLEYLKRLRTERGKIHVIPVSRRTAWQKSRMKDLQRAISIVYRQVGGFEKLAPKFEYLKRLRTERGKIHVIPVSRRTAWQKSRMKDLQRAISIVFSQLQTSIARHMTPTPLADRLGFAVGNNLVWKNDQELASQLNSMAAIGVKWIRHDMQWSVVQASGSTSYNWAPYDRLISEANKRNIKVLPILTYTPSWARRSDASSSMFSAPANPDQFAAFAAKAVQRYAPMGVHAYEIWNEPNIPGFWKPAPNVSAYTTLLKKSYVRIKQADPSATVVSGGLAPATTSNGRISPRDFVSGMYANGGKNYFNVLGHHPYTFPALPSSYYEWSAWSQMNDTNLSIRSIMVKYGDSAKPIWGTEFGMPTKGMSGVSESLQAQYIETAASLMRDRPWLQKLFIYSWKDIGTSTSTIENFFGVVRYDGSYKPGYYSVKNILSQ